MFALRRAFTSIDEEGVGAADRTTADESLLQLTGSDGVDAVA
jgi:hypothetical protein